MTIELDGPISVVTIEVTETSVVEVEVVNSSVTIDGAGEIIVEHTTSLVSIDAAHSSEISIENPRSQIIIGSEGTSGASTFDQLLDTPNSKTGHDGKAVVVDEASNELIFVTLPGGATYDFDDLSDTPASKVGSGSKGVAVNAGATALEYVDFVLDSAYQAHLAAVNPHSVTAAQSGADPVGSAAAVQSNLDTHTGDTTNPHAVTASQAGADTLGSAATVQGNLDAHEADLSNPHDVGIDDVFPLDNNEYVTAKATDGSSESILGIDASDNVIVGTDAALLLLKGLYSRPSYNDGSATGEIARMLDLTAHTGNVSNPHATTFDLLGDTPATKFGNADKAVLVDPTSTFLQYVKVIKADGTIELDAEWFTGSTHGVKIPYLIFDTTYSDGHAEGKVHWDDDLGTLCLGMKGGITLPLGEGERTRVKNDTGSSIAKGKIVYQSGVSGQKPTIALADASDPLKSVSIAMTSETIADGQFGFVTHLGYVDDFDTSGLTEGALVHLSAKTPGNATSSTATPPNRTAIIGICVYSHATEGRVMVFPIIRPYMNELSDVNTTGISDGDVMQYDSATEVFLPVDPTTNNEFATLKIGDIAGGDYTEYEADGSRISHGDATMWKDMIANLFGSKLNSTAGKVDYDFDNNALNFSSGGSITTAADRVQGNQEINHEFKVGTSITFRPHIHWFQEVVSHSPDVLETTAYELTVRYRLVRNGYGINLTTPSWTTIVLTAGSTDDIFGVANIGGLEYAGQITRFPDITVDCGISDTIQFQMARTDSLGGNMLVFFLDMHGQVDADGSREEVVK